ELVELAFDLRHLHLLSLHRSAYIGAVARQQCSRALLLLTQLGETLFEIFVALLGIGRDAIDALLQGEAHLVAGGFRHAGRLSQHDGSTAEPHGPAVLGRHPQRGARARADTRRALALRPACGWTKRRRHGRSLLQLEVRAAVARPAG